MSISTAKTTKLNSDIDLSLEEYKAVIEEGASSDEKYSKVGHLYPEKNIAQFRWFKGSSDRGLRDKVAA